MTSVSLRDLAGSVVVLKVVTPSKRPYATLQTRRMDSFPGRDGF